MSAPGAFIFRLSVVFSICEGSPSTLPQVGRDETGLASEDGSKDMGIVDFVAPQSTYR